MPSIPDHSRGGAHHAFSTPRRQLDALLGRCLAYYEVGNVPQAAEAARQLIRELGELHTRIHHEVAAKLAQVPHG